MIGEFYRKVFVQSLVCVLFGVVDSDFGMTGLVEVSLRSKFCVGEPCVACVRGLLGMDS